MDIETFEHLISADDLSPYRDYFRRIARPCVEIDRANAEPLDHQSRYAGCAFVPTDFSWPTHQQAQYRFLAQINFDELVDPPALLPGRGLLALFYQHYEDESLFWNEGFVVGHYWPDTAGFILKESPHGDDSEARGIKFRVGVDLPQREDLRNDWPIDFESLTEIIDTQLSGVSIDPDDHLLGYPIFNTLGYDPTSPDYISLITLSSDGELDWCWADGDRLMVFIDSKKLAARDFSNLKTTAG